MKKYILILVLLSTQLLQAQNANKPSMLEFLSNVVLFNPSFVHIHETENNLTHDILVTSRWKYEIEFKNRNRADVFTIKDDTKKVLFEQKETPNSPATVIDLTTLAPGIYTIERKTKEAVFVFEVEKLL